MVPDGWSPPDRPQGRRGQNPAYRPAPPFQASDLQKRLPEDGVDRRMHPGWVDTPGVRTFLPTFRALTRPVIRTPEQGTDTLVWLLTT